MKTIIGTPDPSEIRRGRYLAIAESLRLPIALLAQAFDAKRRKDNR